MFMKQLEETLFEIRNHFEDESRPLHNQPDLKRLCDCISKAMEETHEAILDYLKTNA